MALFDPHPSGSEDIPISYTGVPPESKNSQVPPEAPSTMAPEGSSFDEVAREALKAAEEIFREENPSATPSLLAALVEDPFLSVEDFVKERRVDPTPLESHALPKPTSPALAQTQAPPGSERSTPIILDDDK